MASKGSSKIGGIDDYRIYLNSEATSTNYSRMEEETLYEFADNFDRNFTLIHGENGDYYVYRASIGATENSSLRDGNKAITPENNPQDFEELNRIRDKLIEETTSRGYWYEDADPFDRLNYSKKFIAINEKRNADGTYSYAFQPREDYLNELGM